MLNLDVNVAKYFKIIKEEKIKTINSSTYWLEHLKTKAQVIYFQNKDDNKTFMLGLKTPPYSDNGITHILEHSVLNGSKKYPCKEPFVELLKSSVANFINAMTYPDKTVYPFATQNAKDFSNLMQVYLDAIYFPNLLEDEKILAQEGWHYHLPQLEDELIYKGVVYNEMKGVFSQPETNLHYQIQKKLLANTIYEHISGGVPESIVKLTQEEFINYHQNFYHPSNSICYLYGNININDTLKDLNEVWQNFEFREVKTTFGSLNDLANTSPLVEKYPLSTQESLDEKTFLSLAWRFKNPLSLLEELGIKFLEILLLGNSSAPLKKLLLDAEIGQDVWGSLNNSTYFPTFDIVVKGSESRKQADFSSLVFDELSRLSKDGFDSYYIESKLNQFTFELKELTLLNGRTPKGILYSLESFKNLMYRNEPFSNFYFDTLLEELKEKINSGFLSELINKYFLNNTDKIELTFIPDQKILELKEKNIKEELKSLKESLSPKDLEEINLKTLKLLERQREQEDEKISSCIPTLELSDLDTKVKEYHLEKIANKEQTVLFYNTATEGINYIEYFFSLEGIDYSELFLVGILQNLLGDLATENTTYEKLQTDLEYYMGGFFVNTKLHYLDSTDKWQYKGRPFKPKFSIFAKFLNENQEKALALIEEITLKTDFSNKKRIKEALQILKSNLEINFNQAAHLFSLNRLKSYFLPLNKYRQQLDGLDFYDNLVDLLNNFDKKFPTLKEDLKRVCANIFNINNSELLFVGEKSHLLSFLDKSSLFTNKLSKNICPKKLIVSDTSVLNEGFMSSQEIQYVCQGGLLPQLNNKEKALLHYIKNLLSLDYYWNKIRVEGGAYGGFANFDEDFFVALSYRDPNLKKTLDTYEHTYSYLKEKNITKKEFEKIIISTVGEFFTPHSPLDEAYLALNEYLRNGTFSEKNEKIRYLLNAQVDNVKEMVDIFKEIFSNNKNFIVVGNENEIKKEASLFKNIRKLTA